MMKRLFILISCVVFLLQPAISQEAYNRIKRASSGVTFDGRNFSYHGSRNRGRGLMGSGGMNYRYNQRTGLYTGNRNMKKSLIGFWTDAGYSAYMQDVPGYSLIPGGWSAGAGLIYEYDHFDLFRLQLGVGARFQSVCDTVADLRIEQPNVLDTWGYPFDLTYSFADRRDYSDVLFLEAPVLFGNAYGRSAAAFYFMAGVKLQLALWKQTRVSALCTTTAHYDQFLGHPEEGGVLEEMDNHGLRKDVPVGGKGAGLAVRPDVLASLELGGEWILSNDYHRTGFGVKLYDTRLRIAWFVDFGLLNTMPKSADKSLVVIPQDKKWDFSEFELNHTLLTTTASGRQLHNFTTGIRLSFLLGFPGESKCILCGPFRSEQEYR